MFKKSRTYGLFVHGQYIHSPHARAVEKADPTHPLHPTSISYLKSNCPESEEILEASLQGLWETYQQARDVGIFPLAERLAFLGRLHDKLEEQEENLAQILIGEIGKPRDLAHLEIRRARETISATIKAAPDFLKTRALSPESKSAKRIEYQRVARGPLLAICPFNFPINLALHKMAPAWALGIPVLLKPSPKAALSSLCLADFIQAEALPPGFLAVLQMDDKLVGKTLRDARIAQVSFTGSAKVGWSLAEGCPKPLALELGGAAPAYIHSDADLSRAIEELLLSAFSYAGQSCISLQNLFVHRSRYEEVKSGIQSAVAKIHYGSRATGSLVGNLIDAEAFKRCQALRKNLLNSGATIVAESQICDSLVEPHTSVPPTVFEGVPPTHSFLREEVFAPYLAVHAVEDFSEFLRIARDLPSRLQCAVFTRDHELAEKAVAALPFGGVMINESPSKRWDEMPYGGMGRAGQFREGPQFAMEFLCETKVSAYNF